MKPKSTGMEHTNAFLNAVVRLEKDEECEKLIGLLHGMYGIKETPYSLRDLIAEAIWAKTELKMQNVKQKRGAKVKWGLEQKASLVFDVNMTIKSKPERTKEWVYKFLSKKEPWESFFTGTDPAGTLKKAYSKFVKLPEVLDEVESLRFWVEETARDGNWRKHVISTFDE